MAKPHLTENRNRGAAEGGTAQTASKGVNELGDGTDSKRLKRPDDWDVVSLRPRTFDEYIGQDKVKNIWTVHNRCQRANLWTMCSSTVLWLGKTSLAHIIATELGAASIQHQVRD